MAKYKVLAPEGLDVPAFVATPTVAATAARHANKGDVVDLSAEQSEEFTANQILEV